VSAWERCWTNGLNDTSPSAKVGLLFDFVRGAVTWRLNDVNGPRISLGDGWEAGLTIHTQGDFPDEPQDDEAWHAAVSFPARVPDGLHNIVNEGVDADARHAVIEI